MALSKRVRFEVFKRDLFTCKYCGQRPPDVILHVDHIIARAAGGSDDMDNLVTSCQACNLGKSDKPLGQCLPAVDEMERLAAIQEMNERAALLQRERDAAQDELQALNLIADDLLNEFMEITGSEGGAPFDYRSLYRFFRAGLGAVDLHSAMDALAAAMGRRRSDMTDEEAWRYFCGCCWNMIRRRADAPE